MDSTNKTVEIIVQQGQNVLASMKDLKRSVKKKGKERSDLFQRVCANQHSFDVYTYIDATIEQSAEVQAFQQMFDIFDADFQVIRTDFEAKLDLKHIEATYEEVFTAYNAMVNALGFPDKMVSANKF